jgi:hypothetical protein
MLSTTTIPSSGTLVTTTASQTLTNKTLTDSSNIVVPFRQVFAFYNNADLNVPSSLTELTAPQLTVTLTAGETIEHTINIGITNGQSDGTGVRFYHLALHRDGTELREAACSLANVTTSDESQMNTMIYYDTPGAGTYTYTLKHYTSVSSVITVKAGRCAWIAKTSYVANTSISSTTWSTS